MTPEQVQDNSSPKKLARLYDEYMKFQNILPQSFWYDSTSYTNWFNDGGSCCFGNIYYPTWPLQTHYDILGEIESNTFGIRTLYVGDQRNSDTTIAFTFYNGPSDKFYQKVSSKYENARHVSGLFDITMKVDKFFGTYFEHVLDTLGYSRWCNKKVTKNCLEESGGREGRYVLKTNDPNVIIIMDPMNRNVHIRFTANMYSLAEAMEQNVKIKYTEVMKHKNRRLNE
jgi:hypothetical protein